MRAIEFKAGVSLDDAGVAVMVDKPAPEVSGHDVLVRVEAVSVNPVDTKVRPQAGQDDAVLGYDAAGVVAAVGDAVERLSVGDSVYYAGDVRRPGSNAELQLVDARIVGKRPPSLDAASAAALPLTALTAWEALFERLGVDPDGADAGRSLLVIGGAGGVGSIGIQLAKRAGLTVIATASRDKSASWCRTLGADHVVDHTRPLRPQLEALGFSFVDLIANFNDSSAYWEVMGDLIAPQGKLVLIVEPSGPLEFGGDFKRKSASVAWEFMFTRSMFSTRDMARQGWILERVAACIERGELRSTLSEVAGAITASRLAEAHRRLETGRTVGKLVLAGWE